MFYNCAAATSYGMTGFQKIENKKYSSVLREVPFKTFFHSAEWEDFLEKEFSWLRFEHYLWRDSALLSVARCKIFGKEKMVSHPFCEYGGPLPLKGPIDFDEFAKDFVNNFGSKARVKLHPYVVNSASVPHRVSRQFRDEGIQTFWIDNFSKKTKEDLWKGFRKTLRQEIKKSEQCGIEVSECESEDELKQFYSLYVRTTKRHKNIPLPFSAFGMFNEHTNERSMNPAELGGHTKIFLAKKNGRVIGGSVFLFYPPSHKATEGRSKRFIHYFINASDSRFRNCNVGHAILWSIIQKYAGGKYDYFDLGGTRKGSPLEVFKRGWGARERPIYEIGARKRAGAQSWKRDILGLLPIFLMKRAANYALFFKI